MARNLGDLVKKEDFILGSEYLTTVLVVIPKQSIDDWFNSYETICEFVVPRSSKKLFDDQDQALVNVTVFTKVLDTFKKNCRDRKFMVRDFEYNEQTIKKENEQMKMLEQSRKDKFVS